MFRSKKGLSEGDFIADISSMVLFFIIVLIYYFLFSMVTCRGGGLVGVAVDAMTGQSCKGVNSGITGEVNTYLSDEVTLINFLETDIEIDGELMTMGELLANGQYQNDISEFKAHTKDILDELNMMRFGVNKCAGICVEVGGRETVIKVNCNIFQPLNCDGASAIVPLYYKKPMGHAKVTLSYYLYESIWEQSEVK